MQVVQKGLGIFDVTVFGLIEMMLLADVVVPVHTLGQKAFVAMMMLCDRAQDGQTIAKVLLVMGIAVRLEIGQSRFGVFPEIRRVPRLFHPEQTLRPDAVSVLGHFELIEAGQAFLKGKLFHVLIIKQLGGLPQDSKRNRISPGQEMGRAAKHGSRPGANNVGKTRSIIPRQFAPPMAGAIRLGLRGCRTPFLVRLASTVGDHAHFILDPRVIVTRAAAIYLQIVGPPAKMALETKVARGVITAKAVTGGESTVFHFAEVCI